MNRYTIIATGLIFFCFLNWEMNITDENSLWLPEKGSGEVTVIQVNSNIPGINFSVKFSISDGQVEIVLIKENKRLYLIRFYSLNTFSVDGTKCTSPGFRQITYSSWDWLLSLVLILIAVRGAAGNNKNSFR